MEKQIIKVGTFNTLNLALPEENFYNRRYSQAEFDRKVTWMAGQLNRMNADIVGFQEVFHLPALQKVLDASGIYAGAGLKMSERLGDSPAVALASRFEMAEVDIFSDFPSPSRLQIDGMQVPITQFSRPVIRAKLRLPHDLLVNVFVVHLKSKRPKLNDDADPHDPHERAKGEARSLIIRAAETTALRHILLDTLQGTRQPVILMGDFNDDGAAVTSRILCGDEPWRNLPPEQKQQLWDVHMYNVKDIQSRQSYRDVYYTHLHNGFYDSLDHILVSQEFVRQNPQRLGYVEYVKNYNDHLIDETLSDDRVPLWESDHGQVVATIHLERGVPGVW